MEQNVKDLIDKINKIPTLPTTVTKILEVINNSNSSAEDVNKAISTDIGISSKVLKLVNSSYYGLSKKVSSITQSIVILGFNTVQSLALSASVMDLFSRTENPALKRGDFWKHCFGVAIVAKLLSKKLKVSSKEQEVYFLSGLLHDLGKVVVDQFLHSDFDSILEISRLEGIPLLEAERRMLGVGHDYIGYQIAKKWKFPDAICETINKHHNPHIASENPLLVAVVYLSDFLCKAKRIGYSGDYYIKNFQESFVTKHEIDSVLIRKLLTSEIDEEMKKAKTLFALIEQTS